MNFKNFYRFTGGLMAILTLAISTAKAKTSESVTSPQPTPEPIVQNSSTLNRREKERALVSALATYWGDKGTILDANQRFMSEYIDLNSDGIEDGLVLMASPSFCGTGGCALFVFAGEGNEFRFVSRSTLIRNPIIVSENSTNDWRDLIVRVSGGGIKPKTVALQFDGKEYPLNPSIQEPLPDNINVEGVEVFPEGTKARASGDQPELEAACRKAVATKLSIGEDKIELIYARFDKGRAAYEWTVNENQKGVCQVLEDGTIESVN